MPRKFLENLPNLPKSGILVGVGYDKGLYYV
jgi:hypothetical protein